MPGRWTRWAISIAQHTSGFLNMHRVHLNHSGWLCEGLWVGGSIWGPIRRWRWRGWWVWGLQVILDHPLTALAPTERRTMDLGRGSTTRIMFIQRAGRGLLGAVAAAIGCTSPGWASRAPRWGSQTTALTQPLEVTTVTQKMIVEWIATFVGFVC